MKRAAVKNILKVKPYVPGKPIEEVQRELGLKSVVKLASNENPYGPSPKVREAIVRAVGKINRYPDGDCYYLRKILCQRLNVAPEQLVFGNGSDELIVMAVRAFVSKGDEVIIAKPSFLIYDLASRIAGAKVKAVPQKDFQYDLPAMKRQVTSRTKIIFLGNPDNPLGKYFTEKQIRSFLKGLRRDILIFIDEAYFEYIRARDYVDSIKLVKAHRNVIVSRTFSKMYGLAGLRIGYGVAHKELIGILNRVREPFNVNAMAQVAAIAALKDKTYYRRLADKIDAQRSLLCRSFDRLGLPYVESYTNFILVEVPGKASAVSRKLMAKGVIVRDMSFWGMEGHIRVTIGTGRENTRFIKTLKEIL